MGVPFWDEAPEAWDTLSLGGLTLPGVATVSGQAGRKMDTRSRPGADGARVRDRGYEPARLQIQIKTWTKDQLAELEAAIAELHPRRVTQPSTHAEQRAERAYQRERQRQAESGKAPTRADKTQLQRLKRAALAARDAPRPRGRRTPVDIAHPATAIMGIRRVYVTGVKVPELHEGVFKTTLTAIEWTPSPRTAPSPSTASASSASGGAGGADMQTAFEQDRSKARPAADPPSRVVKRALQATLVSGGG